MTASHHVDAIAGRLSLRPPQRRSLEILDRITQLSPPRKNADIGAALAATRSEFPSVTDFERDFPSVCFALATGVGKTRLMGAFIAYLSAAHGLKNFFVLAPNLTIYDKLITDFTRNTPKYVFSGIAEFAVSPPVITTGENYERGVAGGGDFSPTSINIFNISKINAEVRAGRAPRIRSFREEIGQSYFDYLAGLDDLVLIMDESHRYRASAGIRAINELKPVLGLELTATPFVEGKSEPVRFKNIVFDYPLARAIGDGFVKEPAVVTRKDFSALGMSPQTLQQIKLEDGVRLHESVKVDLETYALQTGERIVKPFMLVIARDTAHATELMRLIQSDAFAAGRYADKVIQVDSSVREEETIARLLTVERADEPTEIVIHVNMLKEGWDVTNLYTIVPLRAANARTLIEQSIGRGLRLPYGRRTGVTAVDRLNIVAHDRFQEILDEAKRHGSAIAFTQIELTEAELDQRTVTSVSQPILASKLGIRPDGVAYNAPGLSEAQSGFTREDGEISRLVYEAIGLYEKRPVELPGVAHLRDASVQAELLRAVESRYRPSRAEPDHAVRMPDLPALIARTAEMVVQHTIDIPRILVVPKGEVRSGFKPFTPDLSRLRFEAPDETLWAAHLRTGQVDRIGFGTGVDDGQTLEDHIVGALMEFDDVAYEDHSDLLYDLAGQAVQNLLSHLTEEQARKVLRLHGGEIARILHDQMQLHFWQDSSGDHEVVVTRGFSALRERAYTRFANEKLLDYRVSPADKSNMARYLFGGFSRCLYTEEKFQSEAERKLAMILERDCDKWFKPAKGQFQLYYRSGAEHLEYQPDFVAETGSRIFMLEPKAANQMADASVLAKREAAMLWCGRASDHAASYGGKPWTYALIPHDMIAENMTLEGLVRRALAAAG